MQKQNKNKNVTIRDWLRIKKNFHLNERLIWFLYFLFDDRKDVYLADLIYFIERHFES